jgi:hypothetical protein
MNRHFALALVAAAAVAGPAFADDITIDPTPFTSTRSRAEVIAEMQQFRHAGVNPWADEYDQLAGFRSDRTREQVTLEFQASRDSVAALTGEDSGSMYLARMSAPPTLETQMAEARAIDE